VFIPIRIVKRYGLICIIRDKIMLIFGIIALAEFRKPLSFANSGGSRPAKKPALLA